MISLLSLNTAGFRVRATSLVLLLSICDWPFVSNTAHAQTSVQRDQQELTILALTIAAGGGRELPVSVQGFTETGTVTYNWAGQVTGNITVKSRGLHQFRMDADLSEGKRTTVVNGDGGSTIEADGQRTPIYRQSAAYLGSLTLPYLPLVAAVQDSSTSIVYGGLITHDSSPAYDVRLIKVYTKEQDPYGNRGEKEARDFYIDPQTFLIAAVSDRLQFGSPHDKGVPHEILYSNYQPESRMIVPIDFMLWSTAHPWPCCSFGTGPELSDEYGYSQFRHPRAC